MRALPVSGIVPTRDRPLPLRRALSSLLTQSCVPSEIVVVDASAGPETKQLIAQMQEENALPKFIWVAAERAFAEAGYRVARATSDWLIEPRDQEFQRQLLEGWARAACEIAPRQASTIADWLQRRQAHVDAGRSRIVVGHVDMAALGRWVAGGLGG